MLASCLKKSRFVVPLVLLVVLALATSGTTASATALNYPAKIGYPNSIASTGDSITRAFNTGFVPFTDAPENSWSTGSKLKVDSHYRRILAANPKIKGHNYNDAITGEQMNGLATEAANAIAQHTDYVTILLGANDACTSSVDSMTPVATYRAEFAAGLQSLSSGLPNSRIYVVSVPDVYTLWVILHTNLSADATWTLLGICQSLLADPLDTSPGAQARRLAVQQRVADFNTQLQQVCAGYIHCRFDNDAVFNTGFTPIDINTRDYFHPSIKGQAKLASVSYGATYNFADKTAPTSAANVTPIQGGINVSITATDPDDGVAGTEYQINGGAWTRYSGPVFVPTGSTITYRSVDVNGNIEASHSITA